MSALLGIVGWLGLCAVVLWMREEARASERLRILLLLERLRGECIGENPDAFDRFTTAIREVGQP